MEKYSPNGNAIPISAKEAFNYVKSLLYEYDETINNSNNEENKSDISNPYTDKIIMPLISGKFVEIPEEIQANAINEWLDEKKSNKSVKLDLSEDFDDDEINQTNTSGINLWLIVLVILILIGMYYMFYKNNK